MKNVSAMGVKWNSNRMKHVPDKKPGVFIIFDEGNKTTIVKDHEDIMVGIREEWWKHNFWYYSWFVTNPPEYRFELATMLKDLKYEELWDFA